MMKKGLFLVLLSLVAVLSAQAQYFSPFVRVGVSFPSYSLSGVEGVSSSMTTGFQGGMGFTSSVPAMPFEVEGAVQLSMRGAEFDMGGEKSKLEQSLLYIDVPAMLNLPLTIYNTGVFIGAGAVYAYALKGWQKLGDKKREDFDMNLLGSRSDVLFRAHGGVRIVGHELSLSWERGFMNVMTGDNVKMFNTGFCISYAYRF